MEVTFKRANVDLRISLKLKLKTFLGSGLWSVLCWYRSPDSVALFGSAMRGWRHVIQRFPCFLPDLSRCPSIAGSTLAELIGSHHWPSFQTKSPATPGLKFLTSEFQVWRSNHSARENIVKETNDLAELRKLYFSLCKFLLYLPRSYRNENIVLFFVASDIITSLQMLVSKLEKHFFFFGTLLPLRSLIYPLVFTCLRFIVVLSFRNTFVGWVMVVLYMFYLSYSYAIFLSLSFIYSTCLVF